MKHYWTRYGGRVNHVLASLYLLLPEHRRNAIGERQWNAYFKFGFVRNPWDRAVSLYLRKEGMRMKDRMTFEEFVRWMRYSSSTCIYPVPHTNQLDWFVDPHGGVIVDFIGKFEQIESDWASVADRLNLPKTLPHKNRTPARDKHYTEYYTKETEEIIRDRFRVDIERFEYVFGG
jgi:hypothetical protein